MADGEVFRRKRWHALLLVVSALFLVAWCAGAVVVFTLDGIFGSVMLLAALPFVAALIYSVVFEWFTIRVDSTGLHYTGVLGRRAQLTWVEIEQLGSLRYPMPQIRMAIVARPLDPASRPIRTVGRRVGVPEWRNIAMPEQWRKSKHGSTLDDAVRRYAGAKWVGQVPFGA